MSPKIVHTTDNSLLDVVQKLLRPRHQPLRRLHADAVGDTAERHWRQSPRHVGTRVAPIKAGELDDTLALLRREPVAASCGGASRQQARQEGQQLRCELSTAQHASGVQQLRARLLARLAERCEGRCEPLRQPSRVPLGAKVCRLCALGEARRGGDAVEGGDSPSGERSDERHDRGRDPRLCAARSREVRGVGHRVGGERRVLDVAKVRQVVLLQKGEREGLV
mmetsp:Transcript_15605/g.50366  ORF Transcript_15605/g.50366 Transcript_15605/m.50366 type:complete len:223 (+) Transcript_15605:171-839(+)